MRRKHFERIFEASIPDRHPRAGAYEKIVAASIVMAGLDPAIQ
jgi:hypothetical protein